MGKDEFEAMAQAGGTIVDIDQLRKPNGTKPKAADELVSVMNAKALADDNADLRRSISLLEQKVAALTNNFVSVSAIQTGMQTTIAVGPSTAQQAKTAIDAHIRDQHGGG
jgi:hypothetical protein